MKEVKKKTIGLTVDKMEKESQDIIKAKKAKDVTPKKETK